MLSNRKTPGGFFPLILRLIHGASPKDCAVLYSEDDHTTAYKGVTGFERPGILAGPSHFQPQSDEIKVLKTEARSYQDELRRIQSRVHTIEE